MANYKWLTVCVSAGIVLFFAGRWSRDGLGCGRQISTRIDTLVVRDTLRDTVFVPMARYLARVDTVWLRPANERAAGEMTASEWPTCEMTASEWPACERATDEAAADKTVAGERITDEWPTGGTATGDSLRVTIPIERKVYLTDHYRAVVEGFRPVLVEMELYRSAMFVSSHTTLSAPPSRSGRDKRGRWGAGIGAGYGISPGGPVPYIGIGVQYNLITW